MMIEIQDLGVQKKMSYYEEQKKHKKNFEVHAITIGTIQTSESGFVSLQSPSPLSMSG